MTQQFWVVGGEDDEGAMSAASAASTKGAASASGTAGAGNAGGGDRDSLGPFTDYDAARAAWEERRGTTVAEDAPVGQDGAHYCIRHFDPDEPPLCTD